MHDLTLYDLFQRNASLHGDRPAWKTTGDR